MNMEIVAIDMPSTGNKHLDNLRSIDATGKFLNDDEERTKYYARALEASPPDELIGGRYWILARQAIIKVTDESGYLALGECMLVSTAERVQRVVSEAYDIDGLALNCGDPTFMGGKTPDQLALKEIKILLPILDIDALVAKPAESYDDGNIGRILPNSD
jgi:hypothetical protein